MNPIEYAGLTAYQRDPDAFHNAIDLRLSGLRSIEEASVRDQVRHALVGILDLLQTVGGRRRNPTGKRCGAVAVALLALLGNTAVEGWTSKRLAKAAGVSEPTFLRLRRRLSKEVGLPILGGHTPEQRARIGRKIAEKHAKRRAGRERANQEERRVA